MTFNLSWLKKEALRILDPEKTFKVSFNWPGSAPPQYAVHFKEDDDKKRYAFLSPGVHLGLVTGTRKDLTWAGTRDLYAALTSKALADKPKQLLIYVDPEVLPDAAACGVALGLLSPNVYKSAPTEKDAYTGPAGVFLRTKELSKSFEQQVRAGLELGGLLNLQRWLGTQSPNVLTVDTYADLAVEIARYVGKTAADVWEPTPKDLKKMGLLQAVNAATGKPPRVVMIRVPISPLRSKNNAPVRLVVGKGMVMDTGGLSIKVDGHMQGMNADMMGSAATLCTALYFRRHPYRLETETVFALGIADNRVGPEAYCVEDILHAYDGRTVRVLNTDAEGRLVLADVVAYATKRIGSRLSRVTTVATLTGHAQLVFGLTTAAAMVRDNPRTLLNTLEDMGAQVGDPVARLPLTAEHFGLMEDAKADLHNHSGKKEMGAQTGAAFVLNFTPKGVEAVHLDIARCADNDGNPKAGLAAGMPIHAGVSLLIEMHRRHGIPGEGHN